MRINISIDSKKTHLFLDLVNDYDTIIVNESSINDGKLIVDIVVGADVGIEVFNKLMELK